MERNWQKAIYSKWRIVAADDDDESLRRVRDHLFAKMFLFFGFALPCWPHLDLITTNLPVFDVDSLFSQSTYVWFSA
jgi:hypothetical protein